MLAPDMSLGHHHICIGSSHLACRRLPPSAFMNVSNRLAMWFYTTCDGLHDREPVTEEQPSGSNNSTSSSPGSPARSSAAKDVFDPQVRTAALATALNTQG